MCKIAINSRCKRQKFRKFTNLIVIKSNENWNFRFIVVRMRRAEREEMHGEVVAEESVLVTERDKDKTPVMELLQRLSDSEPPQSQLLEPLQMRT